MGTYSKKEFYLHCMGCGATERVVMMDQGSCEDIADWVTTGAVTKFNVVLGDGEVAQPFVLVQNCKDCGGLNVECANSCVLPQNAAIWPKIRRI